MATETIKTLEPGKTVVLRELSTGTGRYRVDLSDYPDAAIHVYASSPSGLAYDVEVSNIDLDGAMALMAGTTANQSASGVFGVTPTGVRYAGVNVKTLSSGSVAIVVHAKRAGRT